VTCAFCRAGVTRGRAGGMDGGGQTR